MDKIYDLIIIGSGAAGFSASVYAKRAMLDLLVIEKSFSGGGQMINTYEVDNYLGYPGISGYDLAVKFREHAQKMGVISENTEITAISESEGIKCLEDSRGVKYYAKSVIIASGAEHRQLGVKGEDRLKGMGVSYCAVCDGAFFKDKTVAVVGGGDAALEDVLFLSAICKKVYLIHRRDELRGAMILQDRVMALDNVSILWNSRVEEIKGDNKVSGAVVNTEGRVYDLDIEGIFIAVGIKPFSDIFKGFVDTDEHGYIIADETGKTSREGVFAAGDVRTKSLRQIITAAADGANCVYSAEKYLKRAFPQAHAKKV